MIARMPCEDFHMFKNGYCLNCGATMFSCDGEQFQIEKLPAVDQQQIKRGLCPWCLVRLNSLDIDQCPECDTTFVGKLTIED